MQVVQKTSEQTNHRIKYWLKAIHIQDTYISCTTVVVHDRDRPCFFYTPNITHTQTQAGEVTTKAMKALEVYLVMLLVL